MGILGGLLGIYSGFKNLNKWLFFNIYYNLFVSLN